MAERKATGALSSVHTPRGVSLIVKHFITSQRQLHWFRYSTKGTLCQVTSTLLLKFVACCRWSPSGRPWETVMLTEVTGSTRGHQEEHGESNASGNVMLIRHDMEWLVGCVCVMFLLLWSSMIYLLCLGYYLHKEFCCLQAMMIQLFSSLNVKLRNIAMVCLWTSQQSTEDLTEWSSPFCTEFRGDPTVASYWLTPNRVGLIMTDPPTSRKSNYGLVGTDSPMEGVRR